MSHKRRYNQLMSSDGNYSRTFVMDSGWYKPGGDFLQYIKKHVYPDLYSAQDYFFGAGDTRWTTMI
jgi:hypothetical protein